MTAADRILALRPADIRKLDDASTLKLIDDLKAMKVSPSIISFCETPAATREYLSRIRVWGSILKVAMIESGDADDAPQPKPKRRKKAEPDGWREVTREELINILQPPTRTERARQIGRDITPTITATEANEFLQTLPVPHLYGEAP